MKCPQKNEKTILIFKANMKIKIKKKSLKKLEPYEEYFRQASHDYFRNMTSTQKKNLLEVLKNDGSEVGDVCTGCGASWLKLLKETGKIYEEIKDNGKGTVIKDNSRGTDKESGKRNRKEPQLL